MYPTLLAAAILLGTPCGASETIVAPPSDATETPPNPRAPHKGAGVTLHFNNGRELEGVYGGLRDGFAWLMVDQGEVGVDPATIVSIHEAPNTTSEYRRRAHLVSDKDEAGLWLLSQWAQDRGLTDSAQVAAQRTVKAAPEHAQARAFLGHEKRGGVWLDHEAAMQAKGMVSYKGEWIAQNSYERIVANEREEELRYRMDQRRRADALQLEYDLMITRYNAKRAILRANTRQMTIYDSPYISRPVFYGPAKKRR